MQRNIYKAALWALALVVIYYGFVYLSNIIFYIILAIILAFIGRPLVNFLSDKGIYNLKLPRWLSSLITLFAFGFLAFWFIKLLAPLATKQVQFFMSIDFNRLIINIEDHLVDYADTLEEFGLWPDKEEWDEIVKKYTAMISFNKIGGYFGSALSASVSLLIGIFSVFFISFYLLKDAGLLNQIIFSATPDKHLGKMENAVNNIKRLLSRYFGGLLVQIITVGIIAFLGLSIVGVQNALILGIIAGIFNLIPYIGPYIGASFGIALGLTSELANPTGQELGFFSLKILLVFVCVQLLDNFVLQPLIFSKSVKAHPIEIFLVVLISGTLFGILGMIAAIPVYTIVRVVAREFLPNLKVVQKLTNKMEE